MRGSRLPLSENRRAEWDYDDFGRRALKLAYDRALIFLDTGFGLQILFNKMKRQHKLLIVTALFFMLGLSGIVQLPHSNSLVASIALSFIAAPFAGLASYVLLRKRVCRGGAPLAPWKPDGPLWLTEGSVQMEVNGDIQLLAGGFGMTLREVFVSNRPFAWEAAVFFGAAIGSLLGIKIFLKYGNRPPTPESD